MPLLDIKKIKNFKFTLRNIILVNLTTFYFANKNNNDLEFLKDLKKFVKNIILILLTKESIKLLEEINKIQNQFKQIKIDTESINNYQKENQLNNDEIQNQLKNPSIIPIFKKEDGIFPGYIGVKEIIYQNNDINIDSINIEDYMSLYLIKSSCFQEYSVTKFVYQFYPEYNLEIKKEEKSANLINKDDAKLSAKDINAEYPVSVKFINNVESYSQCFSYNNSEQNREIEEKWINENDKKRLEFFKKISEDSDSRKSLLKSLIINFILQNRDAKYDNFLIEKSNIDENFLKKIDEYNSDINKINIKKPKEKINIVPIDFAFVFGIKEDNYFGLVKFNKKCNEELRNFASYIENNNINEAKKTLYESILFKRFAKIDLLKIVFQKITNEEFIEIFSEIFNEKTFDSFKSLIKKITILKKIKLTEGIIINSEDLENLKNSLYKEDENVEFNNDKYAKYSNDINEIIAANKEKNKNSQDKDFENNINNIEGHNINIESNTLIFFIESFNKLQKKASEFNSINRFNKYKVLDSVEKKLTNLDLTNKIFINIFLFKNKVDFIYLYKLKDFINNIMDILVNPNIITNNKLKEKINELLNLEEERDAQNFNEESSIYINTKNTLINKIKDIIKNQNNWEKTKDENRWEKLKNIKRKDKENDYIRDSQGFFPFGEKPDGVFGGDMLVKMIIEPKKDTLEENYNWLNSKYFNVWMRKKSPFSEFYSTKLYNLFYENNLYKIYKDKNKNSFENKRINNDLHANEIESIYTNLIKIIPGTTSYSEKFEYDNPGRNKDIRAAWIKSNDDKRNKFFNKICKNSESRILLLKSFILTIIFQNQDFKYDNIIINENVNKTELIAVDFCLVFGIPIIPKIDQKWRNTPDFIERCNNDLKNLIKAIGSVNIKDIKNIITKSELFNRFINQELLEKILNNIPDEEFKIVLNDIFKENKFDNFYINKLNIFNELFILKNTLKDNTKHINSIKYDEILNNINELENELYIEKIDSNLANYESKIKDIKDKISNLELILNNKNNIPFFIESSNVLNPIVNDKY